MQISELSIEVGDDHSGYGADENLIDHDSQTETEQNRQTFVCRPREQLRGLISSGWNACFFHGFDNRYFKKLRETILKGVSSRSFRLKSRICFWRCQKKGIRADFVLNP